MLSLLQNAVDRMAVSLDNVRLLEEIQTRAERERMVGEIATKVRAATNIEAILSTTAQELGRSLGVSEVVVQLTSKD
jgi:GAF domain-containing protein